ncbi:Protein PLASTID MOVEMENT IMPAIRED 15 [Cardamine amara subsp. amara]|uniref:Protein PLASTID MOVEMENT IMPAIRED 15 n=1 Tax=Cardamine amara subsp. amara TaxID=228776 RepID=A0ABD1AK90_CARAN
MPVYIVRRKLCGYKESKRDSESVKARAKVELSDAKKFVEELTFLIEKSNRDVEFQRKDMEVLKIEEKELKQRKKLRNYGSDCMSRSNRSFERGLSVLKEVTEATEATKEELGSVNAELFQLMMVMNHPYNLTQAKEETTRFEKVLWKDDVKIQKLNVKMLMAKSKSEAVFIAKERVSSLAENLVSSLEKLKKNKEAAKKEERLLKEEDMVTKAETLKTKLEIDEKERELILKLDELEKAKKEKALKKKKVPNLVRFLGGKR